MFSPLPQNIRRSDDGFTQLADGESPYILVTLKHFYAVSKPNSRDSVLNDFATSVLEITEFHRQIDTLLLTLFYIPLTICGDNDREAIQDICLVSRQLMPMVLLLCQRDKPAFGSSGPEPPVIAGAIAAFQYNN